MLMARSTIYKIMGLLILMAAAQSGLFYFSLKRSAGTDSFSLEGVIEGGHLLLVFGIFFLLLTALLSHTCYESGARQGYTLRRLSLSARWVYFWQCAYNALCYLIFWAVQVLIIVALCRLYMTEAAPEYTNSQTVFLAFYRSEFLHALLPFEDALCWVRNITMLLAMSICAARYPQEESQSRIRKQDILVILIMSWFPARIAQSGSLLIIIVLAVIFPAVIYFLMGKEEKNEA